MIGALLGSCPSWAESPFHIAKIVWVVIGEASAGTAGHPAGAGRQLFMADELANFSLQRVQVARIDVEPTIVELQVGERFCVSQLQIGAFTSAGTAIARSPMSISVRQDHKEPMGLDRRKNDICVKAIRDGEYPIRFTSLLPAADGTMRGAQIFVRVSDKVTR